VTKKEAIDTLKLMQSQVEWEYPMDYAVAIDMAIAALSEEPEQLTDKEQRIFLAAMAREEKVCKQVDDECRDCREPYEDSLVRTCHEITRKVKGALWTI
jgi:hypothetical protein